MDFANNRTVDKLRLRAELIESQRYRRRQPLEPFRFEQLDDPDTLPELDIPGATSRVIAPGSAWGEPVMDFALRTSFRVPDSWTGPTRLHLPIGVAGDFSHPEALVYVDAIPLTSADRHHHEVALPKQFSDGEEHGVVLHGWTGGTMSGSGVDRTSDPLIMGVGELVEIDTDVERLSALSRVTLGVIDELDELNPTRRSLIAALEAAFNVVNTRHPLGAEFRAGLSNAAVILSEGIERSGHPIDLDVWAIGHAHIDVAWLWTIAQTRRKAGRTFHNAIRLMDEFDRFHYTQSQPQLYDWVRTDYPELFEEIKKRVEEQRWEPIGGMWVEADCNITGSESLVRQFLLGRSFFAEHFGPGADSGVLWLPDVFGYAWNLPQIMKGCGIEYFFTTKISWNYFNRLPYDSFWWKGLDGTSVLTHFSPTPSVEDHYFSTYNALARPKDLFGTWRNYRHGDVGGSGPTAPVLMSYGWGDGGGGPTREMAENLELLEAYPGSPQARSGRAIDFFDTLRDEFGASLPTWNGELYLEYHQGTYTTHGDVKRGNRLGERALHDAEFVAARAMVEDSIAYPKDRLQDLWKLLCLHQFHDILPGSSIGEVYVDSNRDHARIVTDAAAIVAERVEVDDADGQWIVTNPSPFAAPQQILLPQTECVGVTVAGRPAEIQPTADGTVVELVSLDPYASVGLTLVDTPSAYSESDHDTAVSVSALGDGYLIVSDVLQLRINADGQIESLIDIELGREAIPANRTANEVQLFEDRSIEFPAWNIDPGIDERPLDAGVVHASRVVERGPLRVIVEFDRQFGQSSMRQQIIVRRGDRRVDVLNNVDWQERHTMMKIAVAVDVLATRATHEIQWGNVERNTHANTSWDFAQYETCAHRWVDLSEHDFGVSVMSDSKYGYDISDNVIRLTALRGAVSPDPNADLGANEFVYSIYPHRGDWRNGTVPSAYQLNDPALLHKGVATDRESFASTPDANLIIETIKAADDGDGIIVRAFDHHRKRGPVQVVLGFDIADVERCNLLEQRVDDTVELIAPRTVRFDVNPYEIVSLRLRPA